VGEVRHRFCVRNKKHVSVNRGRVFCTLGYTIGYTFYTRSAYLGYFTGDGLARLIRPVSRIRMAKCIIRHTIYAAGSPRPSANRRPTHRPCTTRAWLADTCATWAIMEQGATECLNYRRFSLVNSSSIALFLRIPTPY